MIAEGNYSSPSLMNNFGKSSSFGFLATYKFKEQFQAVGELSFTNFANWQNGTETRFEGAKSSIIAFQPQFAIVTPFANYGIYNRLALSFRIGPSLALHSVKLGKAPYSGSGTVDFDFQNSTSFIFGIVASANSSICITNRLTVGLSCGFTYYKLSSVLYDDHSLLMASLQARVGLRFGMLEKYKYQSTWFD